VVVLPIIVVTDPEPEGRIPVPEGRSLWMPVPEGRELRTPVPEGRELRTVVPETWNVCELLRVGKPAEAVPEG
jgi:hypothetical protein